MILIILLMETMWRQLYIKAIQITGSPIVS